MENESWLILGGCGYIGRNLVKHLLDNNITRITVADKKMPMLVKMHPMFEACLDQIEFIHADLSRTPEKVFNKPYTYIVNLAGETRPGLPESVHAASSIGVIERVKPLIGEAKWVEISTCKVYPPAKDPSGEDTAAQPWTIEGRYRLEAERGVSEINHLVLRPALVYGNGDSSFITARAVLAAVYKKTKKKMKLMWGADLRLSSVHVVDLCRAILHLKDTNGIYNLADSGNTRQDDITKILSRLVGCKYSYYSRMLSNLGDLQEIAEIANNEHLPPWTTICQEQGVDSPFSPFIEEENLDGSHISINGNKVLETGFQYSFPSLHTDEVRRSLLFLIDGGLLPNIISN